MKIFHLGNFLSSLRKLVNPLMPFGGSERYWINRYKSGGNSGAGSENEFAIFKSTVLNNFIAEHNIKTIIEYGCGDGNQLKFSEYPNYLGFDISPHCIQLCKQIFIGDSTKSFKLMGEYSGETAEITLSLDVIYHLVENNIFNNYMERLFGTAEKFVIIYSTNTDEALPYQAKHIRHRKFSDWVDTHAKNWSCYRFIPNEEVKTNSKFRHFDADFYIYKKMSGLLIEVIPELSFSSKTG